MKEYPVEKYYRDSKIGNNETSHLLFMMAIFNYVYTLVLFWCRSNLRGNLICTAEHHRKMHG